MRSNFSFVYNVSNVVCCKCFKISLPVVNGYHGYELCASIIQVSEGDNSSMHSESIYNGSSVTERRIGQVQTREIAFSEVSHPGLLQEECSIQIHCLCDLFRSISLTKVLNKPTLPF